MAIILLKVKDWGKEVDFESAEVPKEVVEFYGSVEKVSAEVHKRCLTLMTVFNMSRKDAVWTAFNQVVDEVMGGKVVKEEKREFPKRETLDKWFGVRKK